jgi:TetR/AcrR family transcriptional regulator
MVTRENGGAGLASTDMKAGRPRSRGTSKRASIVDAAMRHFAEHGFHDARMGDIAGQLGIAKGSIFQHFGSKNGLFFEVYKKAVRSLPAYLDAPQEMLQKGFWRTLNYWLEQTEHLVHEDRIPYRVSLLGNHGTDLSLKRQVNRFLATEDPYGTAAFVRLGISRGEVRCDIDPEMIISMLDWTMERFQDALLTEELDPGLFRRNGRAPEKKEARIQQFMELLKGAIGTREEPARDVSSARHARAR